MVIKSPLRVLVSKKYFALNLNIYRNTHPQILNKAKVNYFESVRKQVENIILTTPIVITYTLYPKTKRKADLGNVLSIHQKFFEDTLVKCGCIPDDDYKHIVKTIFTFGSVDKTDPRVDIHIEEIKCISI